MPNSFPFNQSATDVRMWLAYNTAQVLPHPSQSSDLNPIEHLWEESERKIRKHGIMSKNDLKYALQEERVKISKEVTTKHAETSGDCCKTKRTTHKILNYTLDVINSIIRLS